MESHNRMLRRSETGVWGHTGWCGRRPQTVGGQRTDSRGARGQNALQTPVGVKTAKPACASGAGRSQDLLLSRPLPHSILTISADLVPTPPAPHRSPWGL